MLKIKTTLSIVATLLLITTSAFARTTCPDLTSQDIDSILIDSEIDVDDSIGFIFKDNAMIQDKSYEIELGNISAKNSDGLQDSEVKDLVRTALQGSSFVHSPSANYECRYVLSNSNGVS